MVEHEPAQRILKVRGLGKSYQMGTQSVQALQAVDLDLWAGEFVVMLGTSGSGKSTLLNILGGLDTPTTGTVWFREQNLTAASQHELTQFRRDYVGFVFQFYNLIPSLTALENVAVVTDIAVAPMPAMDALALLGLTDRADHFPSQLSGGQQQRVAIARAIAKRPEILMCDEPTGALDSSTGNVVLSALQQINRELGTTVVIITHNAAIAAMAHRVIHLRDGAIDRIDTNSQPEAAVNVHW